MIVLAKLCANGEFVFSRAHYDCRVNEDGEGMDGGQLGQYFRIIGGDANPHHLFAIRIPQTHAEVYEDWALSTNKLGILKPGDDYKIVCLASEFDFEAFGYKRENAIWGTYGKDGKGPLKHVNLMDCESDHLRSILKTEGSRIRCETRKIIESILQLRHEILKLEVKK